MASVSSSTEQELSLDIEPLHGPGELRLRREVVLSPKQRAAAIRAYRRIAMADVARALTYRWVVFTLTDIRRGALLSGAGAVVFGALISAPFAFFMHSTRPFIAGLVIFPLVCLLCAYLFLVVFIVRSAKTSMHETSSWLAQPIAVEVYDNLLYLETARGRSSLSKVTRVRERGGITRIELHNSDPLRLPQSVVELHEVSHLEGGPLAAWPSDGGPEVLTTPVWLEEQRRELPDDAVGRSIGDRLAALARYLEQDAQRASASMPSAWRYDAGSRELVSQRTRFQVSLDGARLQMRGAVGLLMPPGEDAPMLVPVAAMPSHQLRALIEETPQDLCDVDIVLDGEHIVRGGVPDAGGVPDEGDVLADESRRTGSTRVAPQRRSRRAMVALGLSVLGLALFPIAVLALVQANEARTEIRDRSPRSRGMGIANAARVLGWLGVFIPVACIAVAVST